MLKTYRFGGYQFPSGSPGELASEILALLRQRGGGTRLVGYLNPRVFNESTSNTDVSRFLRSCDVVGIDGVGIVLAAAVLYRKRYPRAWMTGLFDVVLTSPEAAGKAILIGASAEENEAAVKAMRARAPGLRIVAGYHGYGGVDDYAGILSDHAAVDVVLVGMGTPKSETVLLQAAGICSDALCWNIGGGTIRYYAGAKRRPPRWVQRVGLQWAYRMLREPGMWRRYLADIPKFLGNSVRFRR